MNTVAIGDLFKKSQDHGTQLIEKMSLELALQFWNGQISYQDGNMFMYLLLDIVRKFNESNLNEYEFSNLAWECYLAFDDGEHYHIGDDKTVDPSEEYTKP